MDFEQILEAIEKLSVLELNELVKAAEEKFGVSASAPVVVGAVAGGESAAAAEEKSEFDVILASVGLDFVLPNLYHGLDVLKGDRIRIKRS